MYENSDVSGEIKKQTCHSYKSTEAIVENSEDLTSQEQLTWKFWQRRRNVVGVLAFFGFFNVYTLRVNLSIAVVAMTEANNLTPKNGSILASPEFDWDTRAKGVILSSFFYGYILTQLPGGWLSSKLGGNKVFAIGIGATALLSLITPLAAYSGFGVLITIRVVQGLFEGVTYPCIHAVWSRWAPSMERSRLASFAFSGSYFGTVISLPVCGLLAAHIGWPSIFYVFGTIGLLWTAIWCIVVEESPEKDKHISPAELQYIQESVGLTNSRKLKHPWAKMMTSKAVWAIIIAHFSENWGFYTLFTFLPTFMRDVYKFEISATGWFAAMPYLAMSISLQFAGHFADVLRKNDTLSTTTVRKIFTCGSFLSQTIFMLAAAYAQSVTACMTFLTIAVGLGGFAWAGFSINHLDIAPQHASVLMGISNTFATLPGIISPIIAGHIVVDKTPEEWQTIFFISSAIYLFGAIAYGLLCSGEKQPWAIDDSPDYCEDTDITSLPSEKGAASYTEESVQMDNRSEI